MAPRVRIRSAAAVLIATAALLGCRGPDQAEFEQRAATLVCDWNGRFQAAADPNPARYFEQWPTGPECEDEFLLDRKRCSECEFREKKATKCIDQLERLNASRTSEPARPKACNKVYSCRADELDDLDQLDQLDQPNRPVDADCEIPLGCALAPASTRASGAALWLALPWLMGIGRRRRRTRPHRAR